MADLPTLTIRTHRYGWGDVAGVLIDENGEELWTHVSSNEDFLQGDLTTTFSTRRKTLEDRYPNGYTVTPELAALVAEARGAHGTTGHALLLRLADAVEGLATENARLRAAITTVLEDEETGAGGWGPDVTMALLLREALDHSDRDAR